MTDESKSTDTPDTPPADDANENASTAVETPPEEGKDPEEGKLHQDVEVEDVGPCKKRVKVAIVRKDIDGRVDEKLDEMVQRGEASVAGFRPGKAPRQLVTKRYQKDVAEQVKNEVLLVSLQQLAEDYDIAPLTQPDIDPFEIDLPEEGPLVYEFEVEVRPEFDLPDYKGLKLKKPVHEFAEDDIEEEKRRLLMSFGQIVPKDDETADIGDVLVAGVTIRNGDEVVKQIEENQFRIERQLAFKDGVAPKFGESIKGAKAGDKRTVDIEMSQLAADPNLQGATLQAEFEVKDIKTIRLPELTHEFLHNFGCHSVEQFDEFILGLLNRRLEYQQRRSAREQVTEHIASKSTWDLPEDLLLRQARKAMARRAMEMQSEGMSDGEIAAQQRAMQQDILASTAISLKEHFVLQKIAEVENIDVSEEDIDDEIERMAESNNESPRRLRAQLEREDMIDVVAADLIERLALNLILESAEYEEVPFEDADDQMSSVEEQVVEGEMQNPEQLAEQKEAPVEEEAADEAK